MKNLLRLYRWKYTFFAGTFLFFIAWVFFIDGNNVFALFDLWREKKSYQEGITFYEEQLKQIEIEKAEVLGMKKEGETVFIIVDSDGKMLD
jgi:hypothetical protein